MKCASYNAPAIMKISKIGIAPKRRVSLGNYESVELAAWCEIVFEQPVEADSKEVDAALIAARKIVRKEFAHQWEPYKSKVK